MAEITISNPLIKDLDSIAIVAVSKPEQLHMRISKDVADKLQLKHLNNRKVILLNGKSVLAPYYGPIKIELNNRVCYGGALVYGDDVSVGSIVLSELSDMI